MLDKKMQERLNRLIALMRSALSQSDKVLHAVEEIEACGFKVRLVVDALIERMDQALWSTPSSGPDSDPQLQLSVDDLTWLKSLRITPNPDHPSSPSSRA